MLEWINEDFFWIPDKTPMYNINKVDRFFIKINEYCESIYDMQPKRHFWITIDFCNGTYNNSLTEVNSKKEGNDEILKFLKSRPVSKKNDEEPSKILID